ncbi:MAG: site-specific integrase [Ruminococcus sp.]
MPRRGENIHKRKDGRWEGRYKSGVNDLGKTIYTSVYGKTYGEVKNKLIKAQNKTGEVNNKNKVFLFKDVVKLWNTANYRNLKESTQLKYEYIIEKHILPFLGNCNINCIDSFMINDFITKKLKTGRINGDGGLSSSYVKSILFIVNSVIQFAVQEHLCNPILINSCKILVEKKKVSIFNRDEQIRLENCLLRNHDMTKLGILISLRTGLRIGEVCALKWTDIDFNNKIIHIQSTVSRVKKKEGKGTQLIIGKPKTKSSIRDIPIPSDLYNELITIKGKTNSPYVVSDKNSFVSPRTFEYRYHKVLTSCDINSINYHALRHTFATRCVEVGVDVKTLSEILGHSNVSITLNTYVHSSIEHKRTQLEKLSNISA